MDKQLLAKPAGKIKRPIGDSALHQRTLPSSILQLQRMLGNRRVAQLIRARNLFQQGGMMGLQRTLTVGAADDQYEQEAEYLARQVVGTPDSVAKVSLQQAPQVEGERGETKISHPQIQRYAVPGSLDCGDIVDWLNNNSPYSPEWAQTRCTYSFNGRLRISPPDTSSGGVTLTVKGNNRLTVSVSCPIDRPRWSPSRRPNRAAEAAAWASMRATLDAHEQQHRAIGQAWRTTLQDRFRAINFSVTGTNRADAMNQVRQTISLMQQQWVADAQAAQDAIDPFSGANLNCP